jgi:hypothetical protein
MNPTPEHNNSEADQRLADFTDRLLADQTPDLAGLPSEERDLAETAARLHGAFADRGLTPVTADRMRKRILAEHNRRVPFWQKWGQARQRNMLLATSAVVVVAGLLAVMVLQPEDSSLPASAGQDGNSWLIWIVPVVIVLVAGLWYFTRRKD